MGRDSSSSRYSVIPSVAYAGSRDPAATLDFNRRVQNQGVVDLTDGTGGEKRNREIAPEFSTKDGKRQKRMETTNRSTHCNIHKRQWGEGAFRWVHKGWYTADPLKGPSSQDGELCVLKEFKTGSVYESSFFSQDIQAVAKASEFVRSFNRYNDDSVHAGGRTVVEYKYLTSLVSDVFLTLTGIGIRLQSNLV
jgi:hypothetical protein